MGKVEYAYSVKLHRNVTASEAHEAWVMGEISDKTEFKCCCKICSAQITCVNMDKPQLQMKMREHFKVYGEHSVNCSEVMRQDNIDVKKAQGATKDAPRIGEAITFHMGRPKKHDEVDVGENTDDGSGKIKSVGTASKVGSDGEKQQRKSNLYLLSTLMRKFIGAKKSSEFKEIRISLELSGKIYEYSLNSLFNEIATVSINREEAWKTKVYYGKAIIRKNNNEYWINFGDKFNNSDLNVKCSIKKEMINNAHNKAGSISNVEKFLNKESHCFILGTIQITNNTIYINTKSLDHITCSFDDVKMMSDMMEEE
jgi:hypothetical protein